MDFRHNAARRRRVMRDERPEVDQPVALEPVQPTFRRYQSATVLAAQPTLLTVLPKTPWLIGTWLLSTFAVALTFFCLPFNSSMEGVWSEFFNRPDWWLIEQPGSLGQMFLLNLSVFNMALCYQIYHLRRHRSDDYHGAFQVWKWALVPLAIVAFAGASVPAEILASILENVVPSESTSVRYAVILGSIGVFTACMLARIYFEVRESRWATIFLMATAIFMLMFLGLAWNEHAAMWQLPSMNVLRPSCWWLLSVAMAHGLLLTYFGYVYNDVVGKPNQELARELPKGNQHKAVAVDSMSSTSVARCEIDEDNEESSLEVARKNPSEPETEMEVAAHSRTETSTESPLRRKRRRVA
ncbi:MAG: hypothetical protein JNL67_12195 [Planctomycetaceae bacterium]|nr:hypothetical protein [Planctomycetaceae bacterium]